jgi:hypothetical protein
VGPLALHFAATSLKYIAFLQSMHRYLQLVGLSCQLVLPDGGKQQYVKFRAFEYDYPPIQPLVHQNLHAAMNFPA